MINTVGVNALKPFHLRRSRSMPPERNSFIDIFCWRLLDPIFSVVVDLELWPKNDRRLVVFLFLYVLFSSLLGMFGITA